MGECNGRVNYGCDKQNYNKIHVLETFTLMLFIKKIVQKISIYLLLVISYLKIKYMELKAIRITFILYDFVRRLGGETIHRKVYNNLRYIFNFQNKRV